MPQTQSPQRKESKPPGSPRKAGKGLDAIAWYLLLALLVVGLARAYLSDATKPQTVAYSQFEQWVADRKVESVEISADRIEGSVRLDNEAKTSRFSTVRVDPDLADALAKQGIVVSGRIEDDWFGALVAWLAPLVLVYLIWSFIFNRIGPARAGGYLGFGKSGAKIYVQTESRVTFDDVAGVDEAKAELQEVVAFLRDPKSFGRLGARAPKGTLLVGPPGTGKTLLARAVAGEAAVPFFSISGSEFVEMFVGVGAARVRDLFEEARKAAPSIIFIDELDALGRTRSAFALTSNDEKEQTLNQLLAEIDGFDPMAGVILLAATNRPEILDKALLRAGRFDRQVMVDRPDRKGRLAILKVHARRIRLSSRTDLETVAGLTTGFAGAELANLVNEAAIAATRRKADEVSISDFEAAIERIVAGAEKRSRVLKTQERRRVAYHEMGHALVASSLATADPVQKVSIIPRGFGALGYTMQRPTEDRFLIAQSELEERLVVLMGGRAAEALAFAGDISTGAADDLEHATTIALDMVTRYGMSSDVGQRTFTAQIDASIEQSSGLRAEARTSESTQREVDLAVRSMISAAFQKAMTILQTRRSDLERGVELLLARETINADDFPAIRKAPLTASAA